MSPPQNIRVSLEWLMGLGFEDLSEPQLHIVMREAYEALEMRVGEALTRGMSDELLDEFGVFIELPDAQRAEMGAMDWLRKNVPSYPETVARVHSELETELRSIAEDFHTALRRRYPDEPRADDVATPVIQGAEPSQTDTPKSLGDDGPGAGPPAETSSREDPATDPSDSESDRTGYSEVGQP
jgi:hypothetical protein